MTTGATRLAVVAMVVASIGVAGDAALAGPRKPITKTYTATAVAPDPSNIVVVTPEGCSMLVPSSFHVEKFTAPGPGSLKVDIVGFLGDWNLGLFNSKGKSIGAATAINNGSPVIADPGDTAYAELHKPETISIVACNVVGGSTATVTYTFTFPK